MAVREQAATWSGLSERLVDRANQKGGDDNVTVLMIQALADDGYSLERPGGLLGWLKRVFGG